MQDDKRTRRIIYFIGIIPITWFALLIAPYLKGGLLEIFKNANIIFGNMFNINFCEDSIRTILIFLFIYVLGIMVYESTRKKYRRKEEYGSAEWGIASQLNKKYKQNANMNKLLTKNVALGLNGKKHRRNVNVLVVGGSGAGKTFSYCKPNVLQANTSYVILDPKGEILRDTGHLLEAE